MKNFTLPLLTFLLSCSLYTHAQCPYGNVELNSQAAVNDYIANYPNCTEISGNLKIGVNNSGAYSNVNDLTGLSSISRIMGHLLIVGNAELADIQGLSQLLHVDGNIHVFDNVNLTNLSGLDKLQTVSGDLKFLNNTALTSIGSMKNLVSVGANMEIGNNTALTNFNAFEKLTTVGGYFSIHANPVLNDIDELTKLGAIGGNLAISQNLLIENLKGLESLATLGGNFTVTLNENLTAIGDLNPIMQNSAMLRVVYNPNLSNCAAQVFCQHISNGGAVEIANNNLGCSTPVEIENSCPTTLPVELSDFTAEAKDKGVSLTWQTITESNNEGFEIERSNDAINWESIAWEVGKGNTTNPQKYSFTDNRPILGKSYYRLAQRDFDGKIKHSEILTVSFYYDIVSIYPNPVEDLLQITVADDMPIDSIILYNTSGSEIMRETTVTNKLNLAHLNSGTYIIAIQVGKTTVRQKLLVK